MNDEPVSWNSRAVHVRHIQAVIFYNTMTVFTNQNGELVERGFSNKGIYMYLQPWYFHTFYNNLQLQENAVI